MPLATPFTAECRVGDKTFENVEVVKMNKHTCWVRFIAPQKAPSLLIGDNRQETIIKRHIRKHGVKLTYVDVTR